MKKLLHYVRTTILGGILLLIPLLVLIMVIMKAVQLIRRVSDPIAKKLPFDIQGIGKDTVLLLVLLLLLSFTAGLFMHTELAKRLKKLLEEKVLIYIPGYAYLQMLSTDKLTEQRDANWKPATILVDDNEVICFVVDESEHYCSIFLPDAPMPSSGSICVREKINVRFLPITVSETIQLIRQFGRGAAAVLEGMRERQS
ncbi:hypothetical protein [Deminuibacter soli]|uniref:DUF502 domain-containing protein n=1 Tax=Deminuibacter soli TaxID=2291815 RepID=A0A3E1NHB4_9BACT|nr:hypothetical protein [Deminuibacter soli]RFM27325.1 hypothetical protein DXN05_14955 [Deminuibacter soli]